MFSGIFGGAFRLPPKMVDRKNLYQVFRLLLFFLISLKVTHLFFGWKKGGKFSDQGSDQKVVFFNGEAGLTPLWT